MDRRSKSVWSMVIPLVVIVSLIPQIALAMNATPDSSVYSTDCYNADFGDLPDSYHTRLGANGAYHDIGNLWLGAVVDWEYDGTPTINALGDDTVDSNDDEDGVDFAPPAQCAGNQLEFTVTVTGGSGTLGAWFDWNQNGVWDLGEGTSQAVAAGANTVTVDCPASFDDKQPLNARFRLYAGTVSVSPWGGAINGEVEDYSWTFRPTAVRMAGFAGGANLASLQGIASLAIAATVAFGLEEIRRRTRRTR
jgi:hypothetical protein